LWVLLQMGPAAQRRLRNCARTPYAPFTQTQVGQWGSGAAHPVQVSLSRRLRSGTDAVNPGTRPRSLVGLGSPSGARSGGGVESGRPRQLRMRSTRRLVGLPVELRAPPLPVARNRPPAQPVTHPRGRPERGGGGATGPERPPAAPWAERDGTGSSAPRPDRSGTRERTRGRTVPALRAADKRGPRRKARGARAALRACANAGSGAPATAGAGPQAAGVGTTTARADTPQG